MLTKNIRAANFIKFFNSQRRNFVVGANNEYVKSLRASAIGQNVKDSEYAVRGAIPLKGEEFRKRMKEGDTSFPFKKIVPLNIGNPQSVGQGFIQYNREIIAALMNPNLIESNYLNDDAKERVKLMSSLFSTPIGAYTINSKGHAQIRQAVASYIQQRDGPDVHSDWNKIYLTNGASEGVRLIMKVIIRDKQDAVLLPIP